MEIAQMLDITLKKMFVENIEYKYLNREKEDQKSNFRLGYSFNQLDKCLYEFGLNVLCVSDKDDSNLNIQVGMKVLLESKFDEADELDSDELEYYLKNTGATILFPYIRNIIQTISGYDSSGVNIVLPVINVAEVIQSIDNQDK
jgi:preprotein translocase subunit SecB